jgi:C-terminal processing protease CtpA/Prc
MPPSTASRRQFAQSFPIAVGALLQTMDLNYGPLGYKIWKNNWHYDGPGGMRQELLDTTTTDRTTQNFAISNFLLGLWDAHVSVRLPSSLIWRTPLQMIALEDSYAVNWVRTSQFSGRVPELADEVIEINGQPIETFRESYAPWKAVSNVTTSRAYFAMSFPSWSERRGMPLSLMSMDHLHLKMKAHKDCEIYETSALLAKDGQSLADLQSGEVPSANAYRPTLQKPMSLMSEHVLQHKFSFEGTGRVFERHTRLFNTQVGLRLDPWADASDDVDASGSDEKGFRYAVGSNSFITPPSDFKEVQPPAVLVGVEGIEALVDFKAFSASIGERNGQKIGYLRINSYAPDNLVAALTALRYYTKVLRESTDMLIIDQMNNPGGYVLLSDWVTRMMAGEYDTSKHLRFRVKPNLRFLGQYAQMIATLADNGDQLFSAEEVAKYKQDLEGEYKKIEVALRNGEDLSAPVSMLFMSDYTERAIDRMIAHILAQPGATQLAQVLRDMGIDQHQAYGKPKVQFSNELSFSGADAAAANAKDYGAAGLIGTAKHTGGAGGTVEAFDFRTLFDGEVHLTTSLMYRSDGGYVEQDGVMMDVHVPMKASDILDQGHDLFERMVDAAIKYVAQHGHKQH